MRITIASGSRRLADRRTSATSVHGTAPSARYAGSDRRSQSESARRTTVESTNIQPVTSPSAIVPNHALVASIRRKASAVSPTSHAVLKERRSRAGTPVASSANASVLARRSSTVALPACSGSIAIAWFAAISRWTLPNIATSDTSGPRQPSLNSPNGAP